METLCSIGHAWGFQQEEGRGAGGGLLGAAPSPVHQRSLRAAASHSGLPGDRGASGTRPERGDLAGLLHSPAASLVRINTRALLGGNGFETLLSDFQLSAYTNRSRRLFYLDSRYKCWARHVTLNRCGFDTCSCFLRFTFKWLTLFFWYL